MDFQPVMERQCTVHTPQNLVYKTTVRIAMPVCIPHYGWECAISLGEIDKSKMAARGVDSWQALQLGVELAYTQLEFLQSMGWRFSWYDGDEHNLKTLLPMRGRKAE